MTNEPHLPPGLPNLPESPELAALLAAAQRIAAAGSEGGGRGGGGQDGERALAAFRAARDEGAYAAALPWWRRRGRDDWRPAGVRRSARSALLILGGFTFTAALGGLAVAAGAGVLPIPFGGGADKPVSVRPVHSAPATPGRPTRTDAAMIPEGSAAPDTGRSAGSEGLARQNRALCQAYRTVAGRGKAGDAPAFQRLKEAAGSALAVPAYCDRLLGRPDPGPTTNSRAGNDEEKVQEKVQGNDGPPEPVGPTPAPTPGNGNGKGSDSGNGHANGNVGRDGSATD